MYKFYYSNYKVRWNLKFIWCIEYYLKYIWHINFASCPWNEVTLPSPHQLLSLLSLNFKCSTVNSIHNEVFELLVCYQQLLCTSVLVNYACHYKIDLHSSGSLSSDNQRVWVWNSLASFCCVLRPDILPWLTVPLHALLYKWLQANTVVDLPLGLL